MTKIIVPEYLYKYLGTEEHHFSVLANLEIRFSQPSVLNDPIDCIPKVIAPRRPSEAIDNIILRNMKRDGIELSKKGMKVAREAYLKSFSIDQWINEAEKVLRKNVEQVGVLSLSEIVTSEKMWNKYAENQAGIAIKFNTRYNPLIQRKNEKEGQGRPVKVIYGGDRCEVYCNSEDLKIPDKLLIKKTKKWEYEKEWRVIRDRNDVDRTIIVADKEVSLCKIDPLAILGVYFGRKSSEKTKQRIHGILLENIDLRHVRICEV